ncbi:MAG: hypothetical protein NTZ05_17350 [Chloroflexi bacterium]|nr:hypothetical protein [Chloroflexota bacterium]
MAYHVLEVFWSRYYRPVMRQVDPNYFRHFTDLLEAFRNAEALDENLETESEEEAAVVAAYLWSEFKGEFAPGLRRRIEQAERRIGRGEAA